MPENDPSQREGSSEVKSFEEKLGDLRKIMSDASWLVDKLEKGGLDADVSMFGKTYDEKIEKVAEDFALTNALMKVELVATAESWTPEMRDAGLRSVKLARCCR